MIIYQRRPKWENFDPKTIKTDIKQSFILRNISGPFIKTLTSYWPISGQRRYFRSHRSSKKFSKYQFSIDDVGPIERPFRIKMLLCAAVQACLDKVCEIKDEMNTSWDEERKRKMPFRREAGSVTYNVPSLI